MWPAASTDPAGVQPDQEEDRPEVTNGFVKNGSRLPYVYEANDPGEWDRIKMNLI
jgi:hypothetical protein